MDIELLKLQTEYLNDLPDKLDHIYEILLEIEKQDNFDELLNHLKGIIHSIKGSSGSYEINFISELCHNFEDELELFDKDPKKKPVLINCFHYYELLRKFLDYYKPGKEGDLAPYYTQLSTLVQNKTLKNTDTIPVSHNHLKKILVITDDDFFKEAVILSLAKLNTNLKFSDTLNDIKGQYDFILLIAPKNDVIKKAKTIKPDEKIVSLISKDNIQSIPDGMPYIVISHHLIKDIRHGYFNLLKLDVKKEVVEISYPEKILFIDDDESIHPLVRLAFKSYQQTEMVFCYSAKEAEEILKKFKPDLILLDSMMPEIDGKQFKKELSQNDLLKDIPVIFLTGLSGKKDIDELKKLGAVDVITKPFKIKELAGQIFKVWSKI